MPLIDLPRPEGDPEPLGDSPFRPTHGSPPAHLAGRDEERARIGVFLDRISRGEEPRSLILVWGPRGNGKTVLLADARRRAEALGIEVAEILPSETGGGGMVGVRRRRGGRGGEIRGSLRVGVAGVGSVEVGGGSKAAAPSLSTLFDGRRRPLLVVVDEAHTLEPAAARHLLNLQQSARVDGAPVLVVLAGTPDVKDVLAKSGATFWSRLGEGGVPADLLGEQAVAEAVLRPFADRGVGADAAAAARVAAACSGYPYFTQCWGSALWRALKERQDEGDATLRVDMAAVARAEPAFEAMKQEHYGRLYRELLGGRLLPCAYAAALRLARDGGLRSGELLRAVEDGLEADGRPAGFDEVMEAERRLRHGGFVWQEGGRETADWTPGIPSLATHVAREFERDYPDLARALEARLRERSRADGAGPAAG